MNWGRKRRFGVDLSEIQKHWDEKITSVFTKQRFPCSDTWMQSGGRRKAYGYLGFILADGSFTKAIRVRTGKDRHIKWNTEQTCAASEEVKQSVMALLKRY